MGDVVNSACHLANKAGKTILVSERVYDNVFVGTQELFSKIEGTTYYEGNCSWTSMDNWYEENCT